MIYKAIYLLLLLVLLTGCSHTKFEDDNIQVEQLDFAETELKNQGKAELYVDLVPMKNDSILDENNERTPNYLLRINNLGRDIKNVEVIYYVNFKTKDNLMQTVYMTLNESFVIDELHESDVFEYEVDLATIPQIYEIGVSSVIVDGDEVINGLQLMNTILK